MSWKTLYIDEFCNISLETNSIKIKIEEDYIKVPISDLQTVIFAHDKMVITIPIITRLLENNVGVILCDKSRDPLGVFLPFNTHSQVFKNLYHQINWKQTRCKKLWKIIISEKIRSEIAAIKICHRDNYKIEILTNYMNDVKTGDSTNREGIAAKYYFKELFGSEFFRNEICSRNYALNYGYKILASYISKTIASRGYLTQLGIHHIGESNAYNLTYDFIEIFRYIIDIWVYNNIGEEERFTIYHRHELVNILSNKIRYNNKLFRIDRVIELVIDNYFTYLKEGEVDIKFPNFDSIRFDGTD
ncbi:MAG: type II CRISPR-associated endonuclease Cas1 [Mycoplasmatales bacterium]